MAHDPILLHCSAPVDFLLVVSLGRVRYRHLRFKSTQLVDTALDGISDVRLERLLPWTSWVAGIVLFLVGAAYFIGAAAGLFGDTPIRIDMLAPMGIGFGL